MVVTKIQGQYDEDSGKNIAGKAGFPCRDFTGTGKAAVGRARILGPGNRAQAPIQISIFLSLRTNSTRSALLSKPSLVMARER